MLINNLQTKDKYKTIQNIIIELLFYRSIIENINIKNIV